MSREGASAPRFVAVAMAMVVAGAAARAYAQARPDDDAMFGGGEAATATETSTATTTTTSTTTSADTDIGAESTDSRDALNLGAPSAATRLSAEVAPEDPLRIGGQFYWRMLATAGQGQGPRSWGLSTPALLDAYLDARPNDRVRAFVLGRMFYNPTQAPEQAPALASSNASAGNIQGGDSTTANLFTPVTRGPSVALDQMWLRFDLLRRVFVTAGKQHVRWGTARFWTPTDYLHMQPRNPLLPFDARAGVTMLKLHVPWEERGWNFYAYAVPENVDTTSTVGRIAGAVRAEVVFGTLEVGAGVYGRADSKAKLAADLSFGVWDLDFYGEAALRSAGGVDFVHYLGSNGVDCSAAIDPTNPIGRYYEVRRGSGYKPQATGGVSYTRRYADKDILMVGAEYFYNGLGYSNVEDYLGLFLPPRAMANPATFFYLGRQYAGLYVSAPAPYSWDLHTFTLSALANLTDQSGITRLDYAYTLLTHIRFEAYAAVHWGQKNGEFRLGFDSAALPCQEQLREQLRLLGGISFDRPPALFDLGVGLRVAL